MKGRYVLIVAAALLALVIAQTSAMGAAPAPYFDDFESYTPGQIHTQDDWSVQVNVGNSTVVNNAALAYSGEKLLQITGAGTLPLKYTSGSMITNNLYVVYVNQYAPEEDASLSMWAEASPGVTAMHNSIHSQANGGGTLVYRNESGGAVNTGVQLSADRWYKLSHLLDPAGGTIQWVVTDTVTATDVLDIAIPWLGGPYTDWFAVSYQGNSYGAHTTTWHLDDLSVAIPEPTSLFALAAGLAPLGMLIRRRQR